MKTYLRALWDNFKKTMGGEIPYWMALLMAFGACSIQLYLLINMMVLGWAGYFGGAIVGLLCAYSVAYAYQAYAENKQLVQSVRESLKGKAAVA